MWRDLRVYVETILILQVLTYCTPSNVTPPPDANDAQSYDVTITETAPPVPQPPPPSALPEAGDACTGMCTNLAQLGCKEGTSATCAVVCQHAMDASLTKVPTVCLTAAKTKAAARACGFVLCNP